MRIQILVTILVLAAGSLSAKSLWDSRRNNERGMFADRTGNSIGDILSIQIDEETVVNRTSSKSSSTTSSLSQSLGTFVLGPDIGLQDTDASVDLPNQSDTFNGSGSVADSNLFEAKIAVMIIDVQPNGNLVLEGARKVKSSGEAQYIVVRGIVRGDDVSADNSVSSDKILNASIEMFSEGDLKNAQTKGWIHRLVSMTNVF